LARFVAIAERIAPAYELGASTPDDWGVIRPRYVRSELCLAPEHWFKDMTIENVDPADWVDHVVLEWLATEDPELALKILRDWERYNRARSGRFMELRELWCAAHGKSLRVA
jgi:hypothetical protein